MVHGARLHYVSADKTESRATIVSMVTIVAIVAMCRKTGDPPEVDTIVFRASSKWQKSLISFSFFLFPFYFFLFLEIPAFAGMSST
jgi:hypothetical protein